MIWIVLSFAIIFCVLNLPLLQKIANVLGIKTISNMLFFLGFIFFIFIIHNLSKTVSQQENRILILTQEIALLRKKVEDYEEKNS